MARMVAEQKLQFYPTHPDEATKALLLFSNVTLNRIKLKEKYSLEDLSIDKIKAYQLLKAKNTSKARLSEFYSSNSRAVIADFFAGEGAWLDVAKRLFGPTVVTVANEIEDGRAAKCKQLKNIDIAIHGPFEELDFPQESVDLMLFNPPYMEESNGENLATKYFYLLLERNYLAPLGFMCMVLPKKEFETIKETLITHFDIDVVFKMHQEEFDKWGQYVVIAQKRYSPLTQRFQEREKMSELACFQRSLDEAAELTRGIFKQMTIRDSKYSKTEIEAYLSSSSQDLSIDTTTSIWRQAMIETSISLRSQEIITMPMSPKVGEITQIISAGCANGKMTDKKTGEEHIVAGGVREIEATTTVQEGFSETTTSIRKSVPFLNVLLATPNGYVVKELCEDVPIEEE